MIFLFISEEHLTMKISVGQQEKDRFYIIRYHIVREFKKELTGETRISYIVKNKQFMPPLYRASIHKELI